MAVPKLSIKKDSPAAIRLGLIVIWAVILIQQLVYSNMKFQATSISHQRQNFGAQHEHSKLGDLEQQYLHAHLASRDGNSGSLFGGLIQFAEAGKKKKKEKSEVVVISVNNPQSKGHGGMYPVFIPTCGGGHGRSRPNGLLVRSNPQASSE